jgi:hypothetical protein
MDALLRDKDALQLLAAQLTRKEAGLMLAPLCRAGAKFVRETDAGAGKAFAIWREVPPMWSLELVLRRIDRFCAASEWYGLEYEPRRLLEMLATRMDALREEGVFELVFDRTLAAKGKRASLLGCHTLKVLDPFKFRSELHRWVADTQRRAALRNTSWEELSGFDDPSDAILDLLRKLGLKRRRVSRRVTRRTIRFPADARVAKNEPLWHRAYHVL